MNLYLLQQSGCKGWEVEANGDGAAQTGGSRWIYRERLCLHACQRAGDERHQWYVCLLGIKIIACYLICHYRIDQLACPILQYFLYGLPGVPRCLADFLSSSFFPSKETDRIVNCLQCRCFLPFSIGIMKTSYMYIIVHSNFISFQHHTFTL